MFGCHAIYIEEKIVLILRERGDSDDGVWLANSPDYHLSLKKVIPGIKNIKIFGPGTTGWQKIAKSDKKFEDYVLIACDLIKANDPRIGKIPKPKKHLS